MHVVKTALRESFDNIHVGFLYSSKDETIKIETDRGKIGGEKMLLIYIPHVGELLPFRHIHSDSNHTLPPRSPPAQSGLNSYPSINAKEPPCIPQKLSRRAVFAEYTGAPLLTFIALWNLNRYERTTSPFS